MQRINFQDLPNTDTSYNADTFNTLQDNIENDIGLLSNLKTTDKSNLVNAINEVNSNTSKPSDTGTLLWTNPSPNGSYGPGTVNINTTNYDIFDIIFTDGFIYRLAKSYNGNSQYISQAYYSSSTDKYAMATRKLTISETSIVFDICWLVYFTDGSKSTNNISLVPLYIIGYKTNLFN